MEENNSQEKGCLAFFGGCLGRIIGFIILMMVISFVNTCSRSMMRNSLQYGETKVIDSNKEDIDRLNT